MRLLPVLFVCALVALSAPLGCRNVRPAERREAEMREPRPPPVHVPRVVERHSLPGDYTLSGDVSEEEAEALGVELEKPAGDAKAEVETPSGVAPADE